MSEENKKVIAKEQFEFVQQDEKIFDKEFETKPIGYFKDAWMRFIRNRTNVIATTILFTIILMSVFQPLVTTKNYTRLDPVVAFLPPRIPILENFGIADGTQFFRDRPVNLSTIDPATGFQGNPIDIEPRFIIEETREYYTIGCNDVSELCQGGEVGLRLDSRSQRVTASTTELFTFDPAQRTVFQLNIAEMDEQADTFLEVLVRPGADLPHELVAVISEPGQYQIDVLEQLGLLDSENLLVSNVRLRFTSPARFDFVAFESMGTVSDGSTILFSGQPLVLGLRLLNIPGENGVVVRQNAQIQMMSFRYNSYEAVFGNRRDNGFAGSRYNEVLAANPVCTPIENPANPQGWLFPEGCPIVEVIRENPGLTVGGQTFISYQVVVDYALLNGYTEVPYFLFGTTNAGRDLFSLIWVATRTSLLIGFLAAAINITIGVVYGAVSGYYGGNVDLIMERFSEIVGRIPFLVVLAIFISILGAGIQTLIFILVISGWIGVSNVTRTQFYRFKGREYVLASRTLGAKDFRLIFRHILPNGIGTIITASVLLIPATIFTESTISFLGFGIGHGSSFSFLGFEFSGVSVGVLLSDGRQELLTRPYLTVFPAIIISILMITFNMFGNALRDALNPSLRGSL